MIIRIKKRDLVLATISLIFTLAIIFAISIPLIYAATSNTTQRNFGVWLVISNQAPDNITIINLTTAATFAVDPIAGKKVGVIITFNASDQDGCGQINGTDGGRVIVNLTLGPPDTAQFRTQDFCTNTTDLAAEIVTFNCSINMSYYENASNEWVINVTVIDSAGGSARNDSNGSTPHVFTYNEVSAFSITARGVSESANINFTSLNLGDQGKPAKAPLLLNNTGNEDFEQIKIIAAPLVGLETPAQFIGAGNFSVNATNITTEPGLGMRLSAIENRTIRSYVQSAEDTFDNVTLWHGPGISGETPPYVDNVIKTKGNQTLVFWVDVPASGLSQQTYNATWNMTVMDLD